MRHVLLPTALCLAIAACGEGQPSSDDAATAPATDTSENAAGDTAVEDRRVTASVGPLGYSYDPVILHRTQVSVALPPDYEREESGIKLIPAERAQLLGEEECSYGQSGMVSTCTAEQEGGLEIVHLDEPLSHWRDRFTASRIGEDSLEDVEIGGVSGFRFTAQVEGSGSEYNFLPAGNSTMLVARQFRFGQEAGTDEIARVMDNLRISS